MMVKGAKNLDSFLVLWRYDVGLKANSVRKLTNIKSSTKEQKSISLILHGLKHYSAILKVKYSHKLQK